MVLSDAARRRNELKAAFKSGEISRREYNQAISSENLTLEDFRQARTAAETQASKGLPILESQYIKSTTAQQIAKESVRQDIISQAEAQRQPQNQTNQDINIQKARENLYVNQPPEKQAPGTLSFPIKPLKDIKPGELRTQIFLRERYRDASLQADVTGKKQVILIKVEAPEKKDYGSISPGFETRIKGLIAKEQEYTEFGEKRKQMFGIKSTDTYSSALKNPSQYARGFAVDIATSTKILGGRIGFAAEAATTKPGRAYLSEPYLRQQTKQQTIRSLDVRRPSGLINVVLATTTASSILARRYGMQQRVAEIEMDTISGRGVSNIKGYMDAAGKNQIKPPDAKSAAFKGLQLGEDAGLTKSPFSKVGEVSQGGGLGSSNRFGGLQQQYGARQQTILIEEQVTIPEQKLNINIKTRPFVRQNLLLTSGQGLIQRPSQRQSQFQVQDLKQSQFQNQAQNQVQSQIQAQRIIPKQISILRQKQIQVQSQIQLQRQIQVQTQVQAQKQIQVQKLFLTQKQIPETNKKPPFNFKFNQGNSGDRLLSPPGIKGRKEYLPSLEALYFNVRGRQPNIITPFTLRPITRRGGF